MSSDDGKTNTYFVGLVGIIIIDKNYNVLREMEFKIRFTTSVHELTTTQKKTWDIGSKKTHQHRFTHFTRKNGCLEIEDVMDRIQTALADHNVSTLYAKGCYLDKRFMSGVALNGTYGEKDAVKNTVFANDKYTWIDLNDHNVPAIDGVHLPISECKEFLKHIKATRL